MNEEQSWFLHRYHTLMEALHGGNESKRRGWQVQHRLQSLAAVSASEGYRTLLVDLDAQANSTQYLTG